MRHQSSTGVTLVIHKWNQQSNAIPGATLQQHCCDTTYSRNQNHVERHSRCNTRAALVPHLRGTGVMPHHVVELRCILGIKMKRNESVFAQMPAPGAMTAPVQRTNASRASSHPLLPLELEQRRAQRRVQRHLHRRDAVGGRGRAQLSVRVCLPDDAHGLACLDQ